MKKLLLSSVAVLGLTAVATSASANGLSLDLGGHYKGYGAVVSQDERAGVEARGLDLLQETEIHFGGETTLDNGLTVGVHVEAETDGNDDFAVDESYAYFAGSWGRVNVGNEDGAAYLLQVAAPSADSNVDGIRQFIQPVNYGVMEATIATELAGETFDYANDEANDANKLTYLSPIMNGFQAGVSYTPDTTTGFRDNDGVSSDDALDTYGEAYELAARYEGMFNNVGFIFGAGYTTVQLEQDNAASTVDDFDEWNVGLDLDLGAFGLGVVYTENNNGNRAGTSDDNETLVVGADYTTGPFKLGVSYLNNDNNDSGAELDTDRYTGGVVYSYGPGMSFRGSISYIDHELGAVDQDATSILLGTQINF